MSPFNKSEDIDTVYIDYYPYFDKNNLIRSIENLYYRSPVAQVPKNYKNTNELSAHMPTLFRNKKITLEWVIKIKNWEDRFIAISFLTLSRCGGKATWVYIWDWNISTIHELFKRYRAYWKNSKWLLKINKCIFLIHIAKPLIVLTTIVLLILWLIWNLLFTIPFILVYLGFLVLTIKYSINYIDKEPKRLLFKICLLWPFFLMLRYIYVLIWILSLLFIK